MRRAHGCQRAGFSLIELLIALSIGVGVLAATWSWVWTVAASGRSTFERSDALSSLACARRAIVRDVRVSDGVASLPAPGSGRTSLALCSPASPTGAIRYVWDADRAILWRSSASAHVAEGVTAFSIRYFDRYGDELLVAADGALDATAAGDVRRIDVELSVAAGLATESAHFTVSIR